MASQELLDRSAVLDELYVAQLNFSCRITDLVDRSHYHSKFCPRADTAAKLKAEYLQVLIGN